MLDFVHNIRRTQGRKDRGQAAPALGLESGDGVAARQGGDAAGGDQRDTGEPQRAPAWVRCGAGARRVSPLNLVQRWLGMPSCRRPAIYAEATGKGTGDRCADVDLKRRRSRRGKTPGGMLRVNSYAYALVTRCWVWAYHRVFNLIFWVLYELVAKFWESL